MTHTLSRKLLTVVLACLFGAGTASALDNPEVRTEEGFFQPETVEKANAIIRSIKDDFGTDVVVETFRSVAEHYVKDVKKMRAGRMARFFHEWARERAEMLGVDGVFILLCKEPPFAAVVVSANLKERGFSDYKRSVIARQLPTSGWTGRSSDRKFLEALELTRKDIVLALQTQPSAPTTATPPWLWAAYLAGGLLAVWFIFGLIRATMGSGPPPPAGPGHVATSNGGAVGGMLGGLFGASVGHWLYQAVFSTPPAPTVQPCRTPVTTPGLEELKRRAEALALPPAPAGRPDEKTLSHPGPGGEVHRDV